MAELRFKSIKNYPSVGRGFVVVRVFLVKFMIVRNVT